VLLVGDLRKGYFVMGYGARMGCCSLQGYQPLTARGLVLAGHHYSFAPYFMFFLANSGAIQNQDLNSPVPWSTNGQSLTW
jgi:hypothetical protein